LNVAFLKYSLIRLALFAPLFVLFTLLQLGVLMSVICAALIAFAVSYLFFQKQRDEAAAALHHRFSGKAKPLRSAGEVQDAHAEDSLLDANPHVAISNDAKDPNARS
jgi:mannitol-specific phosphotransferase system IIBC component